MRWDGLTVWKCPACAEAREYRWYRPIAAAIPFTISVAAVGVAIGLAGMLQPQAHVFVALLVAGIMFLAARWLWGEEPTYVHLIQANATSVHTHLPLLGDAAAVAITVDYRTDRVVAGPSVPEGVLFRVQPRLVRGRVDVVTEDGELLLPVDAVLRRAVRL